MMPHLIHIPVRGYHIDVFRHVNNARYLEFLEEARWDYFDKRALSPLFADGVYAMAVVNININYRRAAVLGDVLTIRTVLAEVRERNALIRQTVQNGKGESVADAEIVFVAVDTRTQKAAAFPDTMRARFETLCAEDAQT